MIEILAFAFGIMYSPGPVNLVSLNAGLNGQIRSTLRFCVGVGCAMLLLLLLFGYTGAWLINERYQLFISAVGCLYIAYIACKIALSGLKGSAKTSAPEQPLNFKSGFVMQLLNPKSLVVILPIVTVQFPAVHISGSGIIIWSVLLASMAFGAPSCYLLMGNRLGKFIHNPFFFLVFNISMALLLWFVAIDIAYHHVFLQ